jgi:hypothetical protein
MDEVDEGGYEDPDAAWREMREVVDKIERSYSLGETPEHDWEIYVEYCAALGEPVSERDFLWRKHRSPIQRKSILCFRQSKTAIAHSDR